MQSPRAMSSEGPCTHLMLCVTILKLLIILSLRLCFVSEVWLDTWAWAHKHHLLPFPTATLAYCIHSGPWGPNGWVQGKKLYLQHSKQERWRPWEFMLSIPTRTCFQCRKKAMMFWETQPRDSLSHPSSCLYSYSLSALVLYWKWWHRRKKEDRATQFLFLSDLLTHQFKPKFKLVGRMYVWQEFK